MNRTNTIHRLIRVSALAVLGGSVAFAAPVNPPAGPARGAQPAPRVAPAHPVTEQELNDALSFMSVYAPKRLAVYKDLKAPGPREKFEVFMVKRMKTLDQLKAESPKIYDLRVKQIAVDDEIFGICMTIKQRPGQKVAMESQLKEKVAELFDLGVQERQARIDRLQKLLRDQQTALAADLQKRDLLIDKNYTEIAQKGVEGASFNRPQNNGEVITASPPDPAKRK